MPLIVLWAAGYSLILAITSQQRIPEEDFLLDPSSVLGVPWYAGLVSSLGILGWTTATVIAAGGAWTCGIVGRASARELLRGGSLLSTLLLLDDLFQLHIIVPRAFSAPKTVFYAVYGLLGFWWVISNRRELARTRWTLLGAAAVAFAASIAIDVLGSRSGLGIVAEDSMKFLGILAWAVYFTTTTGDIARSVISSRRLFDDHETDPHQDGAAPASVSILTMARTSTKTG